MLKLHIVIFDVERGFCAYLQDTDGYSMLIDCGRKNNFSPVKYLKNNKSIYFPKKFNEKYLTQLLITHSHGDHLNDIRNLIEELPPALLRRTKLDNYDPDDVQLSEREREDNNLKIFRNELDEKYINTPEKTGLPNWKIKKTYFNLSPEEAKKIDQAKILNNTSHVLLVEFGGRKILFTGDLEANGWNALIGKNPDGFREKIRGVDFFIVPHHGHASGFSQEIFDIIGKPLLNVISEKSKTQNGSDEVDSRYSQENYFRGVNFRDGYFSQRLRRSLTTRNDGSIFIDIYDNGEFNIKFETLKPNINV
jgi:beta-lactamase superfamily II metal-dependent hydrolase